MKGQYLGILILTFDFTIFIGFICRCYIIGVIIMLYGNVILVCFTVRYWCLLLSVVICYFSKLLMIVLPRLYKQVN